MVKTKTIVVVVIIVLVTNIITAGVMFSGYSNMLDEKIKDVQSSISDIKSDQISKVSSSVEKSYLYDQSKVTRIAETAGPSIVGIRMTVLKPSNGFFNRGSSKSGGEGSGVIISRNGYIMTNYHVVEYADPDNSMSKYTTLEVFLSDKRQAKAKYIGGDRKNDLAVIKIDLEDLTKAELGDSSELKVGEMAVAIGNPLGLEFAGSVTVGVISALNRVLAVQDRTFELIQTDAAINPGNSGGALLNSKGQVIGINSIKISVPGVEGLGFAIPINDAKKIVDQLIKYGYVKGRPHIGIKGKEVTELVSSYYNIPVGIYITEVMEESGADKAGLKQGDIIISLAGKKVKTLKDINLIKKNYKAKDTVDITIIRKGEEKKFKLTFSEEK